MPDGKSATEELQRLAGDAGLDRALRDYAPNLEKALASAKRLRSEMPREFRLADEPAHVFRAGQEA